MPSSKKSLVFTVKKILNAALGKSASEDLPPEEQEESAPLSTEPEPKESPDVFVNPVAPELRLPDEDLPSPKPMREPPRVNQIAPRLYMEDHPPAPPSKSDPLEFDPEPDRVNPGPHSIDEPENRLSVNPISPPLEIPEPPPIELEERTETSNPGPVDFREKEGTLEEAIAKGEEP